MKINYDRNNNKEVNKHGTYMLPYEIYRTCIPQNFISFPVHWHEEMEIIYVLSGSARYVVDFKEYIIGEGDILIIPPSSLHSFEQYAGEEFDAATIIFGQNMVNNSLIDICSSKYIMPIFNNEIYLPIYLKKGDDVCRQISEYMLEAIQEHLTKAEAYELRIRIAFLNLIQFFYKNNMYTKRAGNISTVKTSEQIKAVTNYIEENYSKKITLEMLAKFANISVYHLSHIFKKCTGQSPNEYLNHYRLTMAANKLVSEDMAILNIAIDCGYNNISYFNRAFKNKYGVTPKEYRKKHMEKK